MLVPICLDLQTLAGRDTIAPVPSKSFVLHIANSEARLFTHPASMRFLDWEDAGSFRDHSTRLMKVGRVLLGDLVRP